MSVEVVEHAKGRRGVWIRPGAVSSTPESPGSFGKYILVRAAPKQYKKTDQQLKIGAAGKQVGMSCKGKKGTDFRECRRETLAAIFQNAPAATQQRMRRALEPGSSPVSATA